MTAPFSDARRAEVVARVSYQLVRLMVNRNRLHNERPGSIIALAQTHPFVRESLDFRLALSSMYLGVVTEKRTSRQWLDTAISASRRGELFRSVFYPAYKAHRRDPRVTNRGVGLQLPLIPGDADYELGTEVHSDED